MLTEVDIISKARVLLEALPYIQRFKGSTFVIKYGGSFMDDPDPHVRRRVATDIVFLAAVGIHVVVVHGGGKAISRSMEKAGIESVFNKGLRVMDNDNSIKIVEKTLNDEINLEIAEIIQQSAGRPLPMIGNKIFLCEKLTRDEANNPVDLGQVGEIKNVKTRIIQKALEDGYIPIVSPIALDKEGRVYNTNADTAASHVASALHARRLVYLCEVHGLLNNPDDPESLISTLKVDQVEAYKAKGVIGSGMLPKVNSAVKAIENSVRRVHFVDGRVPHSLLLEIFTDQGIGTEIVQN